MTRRSHVPVRTCVGCGTRATQPRLLRIANAADGSLQLVHARAAVGRTAYLHREAVCWTRFATRQGLVRSLGRKVDRAARAALVRELEAIA